MSDGISEGYRAARASKTFEKKWEEARVEQILLTAESEYNKKDEDVLLLKLVHLSKDVRVQIDEGWLVSEHWGTMFRTSINSDYADKCPKVTRYTVALPRRSFKEFNLKEALVEAILFQEWLLTPEGNQAYRDYQDY